MSVTLLINENQKRVILKESIKDEFSDSLKQNYDFVKDIINNMRRTPDHRTSRILLLLLLYLVHPHR